MLPLSLPLGKKHQHRCVSKRNGRSFWRFWKQTGYGTPTVLDFLAYQRRRGYDVTMS